MSYIHIVRDFHSHVEGARRTVRIYTPDAYDHAPTHRFPVLYFLDGQHAFAHPDSARLQTWCANWTMEALIANGRTEPWIIVAVDHGPGREADYSPWDRGPVHARFLMQELRPYIDRTYRTRPESQWNAVVGASLGGLYALYLAYAYPERFGRAGGLSPTLTWNNQRIFADWQRHPRTWTKLYLDAGEHEQITEDGLFHDYPRAVREFTRRLFGLGYQPHELRSHIDPHGRHDEEDWRRRLPDALGWLLA